MNKEDWLFSEIASIDKERRTLKNFTGCDNQIMIKFMMLLIPLLGIYTQLYSDMPSSISLHMKDVTDQNNDGISWKCSACGRHNWANKHDWTGRYQCACGKYKN